MKHSEKIAVAMSGGVDSSVAALLLKNEGFDIIGVNLNLWSCIRGSRSKTCCSPKDRRDAANVCEYLGIPFVSIDMREEFKNKVILNFVEEYSRGRTPNPCIRCNTLIKFDAMLSWVKSELEIDCVATGHYARVINDEKGTHLLKGIDTTKDQSYFLYDLLPGTLARVYFPLGRHTKNDVRKMASDGYLPVADKDESQEVCFVPDGDVASFIEDYYPDFARPEGNFIDKDGRIIGRHRGVHAYTIGQRRGLGIGFGERRYVKSINYKTGEIMLGDDRELFTKNLAVESVNLIEKVQDTFDADVKIRYKTAASPTRVFLKGEAKALVEFKEPVRAVTPGQAAVFYNGDVVIGGGWIVY